MYAAKSGDSTKMGAIGGSSTANGATINSGVLSLSPADATNGGIITTGAQTIAGNKSLTGTLGVGTTGPAASAQLDVSSTTKGFLPPRMTYAQRQLITNPATGLVVFCTDCGNPSIGGELQVYSGGMWRNMIGSPVVVYPTVAATTAATSITGTTATSGGNITSDGNGVISASGVCWSTISNPTIADSKTTDGVTTGSYISSITGLTAATTYYVRAYAKNAVGTVYGTQISFTTFSQGIAGSYQGGKIAYFLKSGDPGFDANVPHGLIAAPSDQSSGFPGDSWGCYGTTISGADSTAIGTGNQNTIDIMNGCATAGIAARICGNLVLNGYNDWYLPSKDELNKLYLNSTAIGGFDSNAVYWSSTEFDLNRAWSQDFLYGYQTYFNKYTAGFVRAVRAF
jgi:hypothetical protein